MFPFAAHYAVSYADDQLVVTEWTEIPGVVDFTIDGPDIPAEVHNTRPVDAERCMQAVRALCGG
jgi:hypothetical protein